MKDSSIFPPPSGTDWDGRLGTSRPPLPPSRFGRPNHISIYNDKQIQLVLETAAAVLNQLGYVFGPQAQAGAKMRLAVPKLPMCN